METVMAEARDKLVAISADEDKKFLLDQMEKAERDYNSAMGWNLRKGMAEGKAEGKAEVARKMKAEGFDSATIAGVTELTVEQVERL